MKNNYIFCPDCLSKLTVDKTSLSCHKCHRLYPVKEGILNILPENISENKRKEDEVYNLGENDNAWYNNRIWYYLIHLSSHIIRFEIEFLPKIKGPKVLELACGNGWASMLIKRKHPEFEVYSTDVSFNSINIQGKQMSRILETSPDAFIVCDAEKLPFKENSFDTIFVMSSLHHFLDIPTALKEAKRVLKPGGILIAADGMMPKIAGKILNDVESERTNKYGILEQKITFDQWTTFLKRAGLPLSSLKLNYDTGYLHSYATNEDEARLIRKSWLFNTAKEIIYGGILSKFSQKIAIRLKLTSIFPAGIIIEYHKNKK